MRCLGNRRIVIRELGAFFHGVVECVLVLVLQCCNHIMGMMDAAGFWLDCKLPGICQSGLDYCLDLWCPLHPRLRSIIVMYGTNIQIIIRIRNLEESKHLLHVVCVCLFRFPQVGYFYNFIDI